MHELIGASRIGRLPRLLRDALGLVWTTSPRMVTFAAFLALTAGAGLGTQLIVGRYALARLLDALGEDGVLAEVLPYAGVLVAISMLLGVVGAMRTSTQRKLQELAIRRTEAVVSEATTTVELEAFESAEFHDRVKRATEAGSRMPGLVVEGALSLGSSLAASAGIVLALGSMQPLLLPFIVVSYLPLLITSARHSEELYSFYFGHTPVDRLRLKLGAMLTDRDYAAEVRAFGLQSFLIERWSRLYDERTREIAEVVRRHVTRTVASSLVGASMRVVTWGFLGWLLVSGRMPLAAAVVAALGVHQLGGHVGAIVAGAARLYEGSLYVADFLSLQELAAHAERSLPKGVRPSGFRTIQARGVTFRYPGAETDALRGIDLEISSGQIVGLVGENGSGKTTLAKLLAGLYRPRDGQILWDGVDVSAADPRQLRRAAAVILQDFLKYQFRAFENVGLGDTERIGDRDAIRRSAVHVGADETISTLPRGYESMLSKRYVDGMDLSIGQWQRVALARAFFRDAPFIILDEPTAALDPRAEAALFEAIRTLCQGRAVILISHRFSSVRTTDHIYVLDGGRVVEHGTHGDLMALRGSYAELFTLQASQYVDG